MVVVDVDVNLDIGVCEIEEKVDKGCLKQSSTMGLITTRDQSVDLVYVIYFKLKHRQERVSY